MVSVGGVTAVGSVRIRPCDARISAAAAGLARGGSLSGWWLAFQAAWVRAGVAVELPVSVEGEAVDDECVGEQVDWLRLGRMTVMVGSSRT